MKPAAFFLSLLMLFFTAQPLLIRCRQKVEIAAMIKSCCGGQSCGKEKKSSGQNTNKSTDTNSCNPFAFCSHCQYEHTTGSCIPDQLITVLNNPFGSQNQNILPGFTAGSWQPPEFA